jgi:putative ABC transport system permease protein
MFKNYLAIAVRNLFRHKVFSALTILGLATGIAASFILIQYNFFEMSYDNFHKNGKNIYRLGISLYDNGKLQTQVPKNFSALGPALKNDHPEILDYVRVFPIDGTIAIKRDNIVFNEKNVLFADASMLQIFSFPIVKGDPVNALKEPYSIVLSQSTAKKYFNEEDPIGKQLTMREGSMDLPFVVKAVVEDVPENSHLAFDVLVSHATLEVTWGERASHSWGEALFYTYILVAPGTSNEGVRNKLTPALIEKYSGWKPPVTLDFIIQPLQDIYLHSDLVQEARVNGSGKQVNFLWIIAVFIVLLAWINYINLSTSRAIERAKEVGIRKVVGANKFHLFQQFIFESLVINLLSIILAFAIVQGSLPYLNSFTGKSIPISDNPVLLLALLLFFTAGSVFSAIVPSLILSSLKVVRVLKGKLTSSFNGVFLRRSFVVFQFAISIALLGGTFIVFLQLNFMRGTDLGADISQTIVLQSPDVIDSTYKSKVDVFKNELAKNEGIAFAVSSSSIPGKPDNIIQGGLRRLEKSDDKGANHYNFGVDRNFIDAYKIKIVAGRNFSSTADEQSVLINKTAAGILGFEKPADAIGRKISTHWTREKTIIGIVEDFHQQSLRSAYDPIVFSLDDSGWGYYSIKLNLSASGRERSLGDAILLINEKWSAAFPGNPFDYFFLDDYFNEQYKDDVRFGKVLNIFSCLTLFIACLGIIGLSIFNAAQRTKEIGVRKVLGASILNILRLLSAEYGKIIFIALLIALPLTYYYVDQWLQGFVFHIVIQWWMLIVPGCVVLIVSLLAVSTQSFKAALTNPVNALKNE